MVLHPSEAHVLSALRTCRPNGLTVAEIVAAAGGWSAAAIRTALRAVEVAGFVERVAFRHAYQRGRLAATWRLTTYGGRMARRIERDPVGRGERREVVEQKEAS